MRNSKPSQEGYFLGGYKTESGKQGFYGDIEGKPVNAVVNKKGELSFFDENGILKSETKENDFGPFYIVSIYGKEYLAALRYSEEKRKKYVKLNLSKPKEGGRQEEGKREVREEKRSSYANKSSYSKSTNGGGYSKGKAKYNKPAPKPYEGGDEDISF